MESDAEGGMRKEGKKVSQDQKNKKSEKRKVRGICLVQQSLSPLHILQCVERFSRIIKSGRLMVYHAGQLGEQS